jgi:hypothetical protein
MTPFLNAKPKSSIPKEYAYNSSKMIFSYDDGTTKIDHAINFIKRGEDNFNGYSCDAGKKFIRIDHTKVQRAICGEGEKWSIFDETLFSSNSVECTKSKCDCTLDIIQTKKHK